MLDVSPYIRFIRRRAVISRRLIGCPHTLAASLLLFTYANESAAQWPQWGGPSRDFTVKSERIADTWPEGGPRKLWHRELGDGYSSIVADDGLLYTMYRTKHTDEHEIVIALDAATGRTVWEHRYRAELTKPVAEWGHGPNATPLVVEDRLYTIGTKAMLHCLDKKTGNVLWKRDLVAEFGSPVLEGVGYSCSPMAYKDTIIVPLGYDVAEDEVSAERPGAENTPAGPLNRSLIALDRADGKLVWKSADLVNGVSSPILISFERQEQIVVLLYGGIAAVDPTSGAILWQMSFEQPGQHIMSPVFDGEDSIFCASQQDTSGGRVIRLTRANGKTVPEEAWYDRRIRTGLGTPIWIDDHLYVPGGQRLMAVNVETGKRVWSKGGFESATCVLADGKLIILDLNGRLSLATATPEKLTIHAQAQVAERFALSAPTLVGRTLYVRDRKHIMALDVGASPSDGS
jgi:outer membrane protein assembly factor BamB